ncbi:hypothetical protein AB6A40_006704 [Gnathostoma spinigerum]|uniref:Uncharacterized protein n=1 Tax=Gnathostoma spinigerum TaxID=75299 RepID=A0ABD6EUS4_9BILA
MTDDPMREIHLQDSHVGGVIVIGRHTFTSLMFRLPDYLTGRTANDLTCTNALPILLQLCNENNIELIQHRGEDGLVRVDDMDDLTIKLREA